ncbi:MAG: long-chain fatty acid--CoA ligase [Gemmatimonadota bacterium]|nr:long-chain fatty acid--CoA ligase [Gemmatimonadota bacterium]
MTTNGPTDHASAALIRDLLAVLAEGVETWPRERFEGLALRVFRHQYERNATYRRFCEGRGRRPDTVTSWTDVPAVPVSAFKALDLACGEADRAEAVFRTSGTTGGAESRGRHFVPYLDLYRASLEPPFRSYVVPDVERIRFVSLVPRASDLPDSSLSFMVTAAAARWASDASWVVDAEGRLDEEALARALAEAAEAREPVLLLGTAFAFVHALDRHPSPLRALPPGSRIMETGGFKGRSRELTKDELHTLLSDRTGVPRARIVNEYGMTELLSQLYEPVLVEGAGAAGTHRPPPWLAVRALDPVTLDPVTAGEEGLLAFFDLANAGSVSHVLTEDVGSVVDGRVKLVGRLEGAEPRGCSRAMDELMSAGR